MRKGKSKDVISLVDNDIQEVQRLVKDKNLTEIDEYIENMNPLKYDKLSLNDLKKLILKYNHIVEFQKNRTGIKAIEESQVNRMYTIKTIPLIALYSAVFSFISTSLSESILSDNQDKSLIFSFASSSIFAILLVCTISFRGFRNLFKRYKDDKFMKIYLSYSYALKMIVKKRKLEIEKYMASIYEKEIINTFEQSGDINYDINKRMELLRIDCLDKYGEYGSEIYIYKKITNMIQWDINILKKFSSSQLKTLRDIIKKYMKYNLSGCYKEKLIKDVYLEKLDIKIICLIKEERKK